MAARAHATARLDPGAAHVAFEDAVRAALKDRRPSLEDILSLWPQDQHDRLVLWARLGRGGEVAIGAQLRDEPIEGAGERCDLARDVRRIRGDIPVVVELAGAPKVVLPLRALHGAR
jgi:hypothetical protein